MIRLIQTLGSMLFLSTLLFSCQKSKVFDNHIEYLKELTDCKDQLTVTNTSDDLVFVAQYIPNEKYVLQRLVKKDKPLDSLSYRNQMDYINNKLFFRLKLSDRKNGILGDSKNPDESYYAKLQYFMDPARYDINLIHGQDTLLCQDYHFERYYDFAPHSTVLITFNVEGLTLDKDLQVQFNYPFIEDKTKLSAFKFNADELGRLPKLNI